MSTAVPYTVTPSPGELVADLPPPARRAVAQRLRILAAALDADPELTLPARMELVADVVGSANDMLWLAHSVIGGVLPGDEDVSDMLVRARLSGTWAALRPLLVRLGEQKRFAEVEVLRDVVTCDVHTTVESGFLSGIQRVVRETVTRWHRDHELELVGWTTDLAGLRRISVEERRGLLPADVEPLTGPPTGGAPTFVVPWESTHLWVEVVTDLHRTSRLLALAHHSRNEVGVLGFDSIPITSSGTVAPGMTSHFARSMAAVRQADRVAMISQAAADEYRGVVRMGAGRHDRGPVVGAVPLAVAAPETTSVDLEEARSVLVVDGLPMVLVVGSHEPRKNHLAVLHAAELLWREGLQFSLVLVGAGAWNTDEYQRVLGGLIGAGRPVQSIRALPDHLLWAAYRLARGTVFPSLNEGFGLPVAESLAAGTPVITSSYGSMRDIVARDGVAAGGLLVDPRHDDAIAGAIRLLLDDDVHERLRSEAAQHVPRSWDEYAAELWDFLIDGGSTSPTPG